MNDASSESSQRIGRAISSGSAQRSIAIVSAIRARSSGSRRTAIGHVGERHAGAQRVDPDALARDLLGEADGEAVDRALGGGVGGAAGAAADRRRHRGDVDDRAARAAARGRHPAHRLAAAQHRADHVDREQALEPRLLELGDRRLGAAVDAGAVDQRGEPAEALVDLAEHAHHLVLLRDVGLDRDRLAARGLDLGDQRLGALALALVVDRDRVAPRRGEPGGRRADAARRRR